MNNEIMGFSEWMTHTFGYEFMKAYANIHGKHFLTLNNTFAALYQDYVSQS